MQVDRLIQDAISKLQGRFPRYIDLAAVGRENQTEIADMAMERLGSAMEQAILSAQSILRSTSQEYIEALYISDDLRIEIREDKKYLEDGYGPREMLPDLLASGKAHTSANGVRTISVPIGKKPDSNLQEAISKKAAELFTKGKSAGASGNSLKDSIAAMRSLASRSENAPVTARSTTGGQKYATASSNQNPSEDWVHPGFQGVNQLEFINETLRVELESGAAEIIERRANEKRR